MPNKEIKKVKDDFGKLMEAVGIDEGSDIIESTRLFLTLAKRINTKEKELAGLSICCFSKALDEHYQKNYTPDSLIIGDYCYAQGILCASQTYDEKIVEILSSAISSIITGSGKFSSMEEAAGYLAGYMLGKDNLDDYIEVGRLFKEKDKTNIKTNLEKLGFEKETVESLAK